MTNLKCVAIDDEPLALKLINKYAEQFPSLTVVEVFEDAVSGAKFLSENEIDLLFIDVNMPDLNGVDLVRGLERKPLIIFTTAYKNYAFESFELEAIAYLLKPISFKRFAEAVDKTVAYFNYKNKQQDSSNMDNIYVYAEYKMLRIPLNNVLYIESLSDYVKIHFIDGSKPVLTLTTLKKILEKLPSPFFLRIHRSYIVAKTQINSFQHRKIILKTITLPIGDSYYERVQQSLRA